MILLAILSWCVTWFLQISPNKLRLVCCDYLLTSLKNISTPNKIIKFSINIIIGYLCETYNSKAEHLYILFGAKLSDYSSEWHWFIVD